DLAGWWHSRTRQARHCRRLICYYWDSGSRSSCRAGVPANWVFRATLDPQQNEPAGVARRVMLSFLTPLVLAPCFAVAAWQSGAVYAIGHTLYVLALSLTLIELFLAGYRKVPLTCPMPGFREHFLMLCLVQFVGFEVFTRVGDGLERWMWLAPWRF